ncbi:hypothetical protein Pan241w_27800 [Gimesia alba]|uniref:Uncharacterized protein n=1 Tax=Gimesia alba TaxID=2527973 RepID=A0A517RFM9_9PLAN|nr:hypothetical protein [Gimesia alba]QDT42692.1 hypothetical protein Pan241w_27800 [Gimesia alba]
MNDRSKKSGFTISLLEVAVIFFIQAALISFLMSAVNPAKYRLKPDIDPKIPSTEYSPGFFDPPVMDPDRYETVYQYPSFRIINPTHGLPVWMMLCYPLLFGLVISILGTICVRTLIWLLPRKFQPRLNWKLQGLEATRNARKVRDGSPLG